MDNSRPTLDQTEGTWVLDDAQIKYWESEAALAESSLELYPGNDYWCDRLTTARNTLKELGALPVPFWMGEEEVAS